MVRGGGTGSRNKKKKAGEGGPAPAAQNGVDHAKQGVDGQGDKHKNIKHNRKQKVHIIPGVYFFLLIASEHQRLEVRFR